MKLYSKLVRDKIPEIIEATGATCKTIIMNPVQYVVALQNKLYEELAEYTDTYSIEELADLLEVIYAVAKARGVSATELDALREEKAAKKGRFDKMVFLCWVSEDGE